MPPTVVVNIPPLRRQLREPGPYMPGHRRRRRKRAVSGGGGSGRCLGVVAREQAQTPVELRSGR
jgi:hypothetical protein